MILKENKLFQEALQKLNLTDCLLNDQKIHIYPNWIMVDTNRPCIKVLFDQEGHLIDIIEMGKDEAKTLATYTERYQSHEVQLPHPFEHYSLEQFLSFYHRLIVTSSYQEEHFVGINQVFYQYDGKNDAYLDLLTYIYLLGNKLTSFQYSKYRLLMNDFASPSQETYLKSLLLQINDFMEKGFKRVNRIGYPLSSLGYPPSIIDSRFLNNVFRLLYKEQLKLDELSTISLTEMADQLYTLVDEVEDYDTKPRDASILVRKIKQKQKSLK